VLAAGERAADGRLHEASWWPGSGRKADRGRPAALGLYAPRMKSATSARQPRVRRSGRPPQRGSGARTKRASWPAGPAPAGPRWTRAQAGPSKLSSDELSDDRLKQPVMKVDSKPRRRQRGPGNRLEPSSAPLLVATRPQRPGDCTRVAACSPVDGRRPGADPARRLLLARSAGPQKAPGTRVALLGGGAFELGPHRRAASGCARARGDGPRPAEVASGRAVAGPTGSRVCARRHRRRTGRRCGGRPPEVVALVVLVGRPRMLGRPEGGAARSPARQRAERTALPAGGPARYRATGPSTAAGHGDRQPERQRAPPSVSRPAPASPREAAASPAPTRPAARPTRGDHARAEDDQQPPPTSASPTATPDTPAAGGRDPMDSDLAKLPGNGGRLTATGNGVPASARHQRSDRRAPAPPHGR